MTFAPLLLAAETTTDPALTEVCGTRPSWFCEWTWNATGNRMLSRAVDWLISRPIAAIVVIAVAALLNRWLRRGVGGLIHRVTAPPAIAVGAMERMGVTTFSPDPREETRTRTLTAVAKASVSTIIWTITALLVLGLFNVQLAPLLAGAGIAGIAVGFGAQSLVRDTIAGFFMLLEDQCGVGDEIDISTVAGTVETITMRATQIRAADGTLWTVPNGAILRVGNQSRNWAQANIDILVGHDADLDRVADLAARAAATVCAEPDVAAVMLRDPQVVGVERVDASGSLLRLTVRTTPGQQGGVARKIRLGVKQALDAEGLGYHPPA
ncbi:MAG: hypothetical protein RJA49_630 [Actinomycetota bacterium]